MRHSINITTLVYLVSFITLLLPYSTANFEFREKPQNQSILLGKQVVLKCSAPASNTKFDSQSQWRTNTGALLSFHDSGPLPGYGGRYSYVKESPEELHLQIDNISLADDGKFECQMLRPPNKFLRAAAFVNVLVPPSEVHFHHYKSGTTIEVNEDTPLNITCVGTRAKPEADVSLFLSGKKITDNVQKWAQRFENGTADSFTSISWKPSKSDHNKLLSCEANHRETSVNLRNSITLHVLYSSDRPKIDLINGGEKLKTGQNITLMCSAEGGNPPPRLLWSTPAGLINSTYQYDFTNQITRNAHSFVVTGSDNAVVYECSSSNRENVAALKKSITLHVDYPPSAVYLYGSTTVRKGESVVVSCQSGISSPTSVITWQVNGQATRLQAQFEKRQAQGFVTESNITIDSSTLLSGQNQITVECIANNNEGPPVSNQHIVRVLSPPSHPVIFEPEQNTALLEGASINLTCEAQGGHPLATLSWYRGLEKLKEVYGSNLGDSSRSIVTIQLDRSMNQQQIRCEAENGATDQPLVAKKVLSVMFPPSHMKIHTVENGNYQQMTADSPARLSCHVPSSNPPAEVTWEFESKTSNGAVAKSGQYTKKSNRPIGEYKGFEVENVIQFIPTEEMDKTIVRCIASHPQWNEVKASSFTLDVHYPPRVAVDGPITLRVGEGESFEEAISIFANPHVTNYQWRKNGVGVERSIGSIYVRGPVIGGTVVSKDDSGIYSLKASNRIGTANVSISLTVEYAAHVTYLTSPVIAGVGEDVVLECEGDGYPLRQGMVKWFRGNSELKSIVQDQKRAVLRLNASHETGGAYTCVVDNGVGRPNYTTAYLLVRRAPVILPGFDRAAGPIGGKATLRCRAVAVPNAEFTWGIEGDGQMINHNTSKYKFFDTQLDHFTFQSTLTILNLEERDYLPRYRCRVNNKLGLVQSFISLGPPTAPDMPMELEVINVTDKTVSLSWRPGFDGGSDQFFELRYQAVSDSDYKSVNSSGSVEIDESKFGKRKYNRGYRVDGSWVFGGISRNSGDVFMVQVEKRDKTTLLPLIRQWILPQTTIICNGWRAYNTLEEEDYEVLRVIHKKTFKTPASQVPAHIPDRSRNKIQLSDLKAEHTYRIQIRAINARGRVSEFSTPVLQFRTLDENLQGVYKVATENGSFTKSVMIIILAVLVILVVVNLCLLYCCRRSQRKKKLQEKTEIARTLNHSTDGSGRPIQIYGTMTGTPGANRRPDSNNTNKSELLNEPVSEDNQSVRTIIEVNPNGYMVQHDPNNDFYESNCIADYDMNHDFYSPINKSLLNNGATYAAVPYPEPPYGNGSNSLIYSDISHNNYAIESPSPHRHMMNLRNGGAYTLPMDQQGTFVGGANDYGVVMNGVTANGHYHPQSNSLNLGGNPVSNNNNNYESTLTRSQPPQLRSPRMMSTFVHQPQRSGAGSLMGVSVCDPNEGDLV